MFHSLNQAFKIMGFLGRSAWCWEQHEGRRIWTYYVLAIIRHPGFIIISPTFFCLLVLFPVIRGLAIADVQWVLNLWALVFVETAFHMNIEFCCHLCCRSSVVFRHNPFQCTAISSTLFWLSATVSLSWWCHPMICVCHHTLGNCCSGYS